MSLTESTKEVLGFLESSTAWYMRYPASARELSGPAEWVGLERSTAQRFSVAILNLSVNIDFICALYQSMKLKNWMSIVHAVDLI